jgi:hypothetical protein
MKNEKANNSPSEDGGKAKLRSRGWFGKKDKDGIIYRSWMKNQGMPTDMFDGRPVIGICNTFSELTPCNAHFREDFVMQQIFMTLSIKIIWVRVSSRQAGQQRLCADGILMPHLHKAVAVSGEAMMQ